MRERGFTLIELMVVIAVMGIMMVIATHNWHEMVIKSAIESENRELYADLMEVRLQALHTKTARSVDINGLQFRVYSTADTSVAPILTKQLRYPVDLQVNGPLTFDTQGLATGALLPPDDSINSLCVNPDGAVTATQAAEDSIVISRTKISLGKRQNGGVCANTAIDKK